MFTDPWRRNSALPMVAWYLDIKISFGIETRWRSRAMMEPTVI